VQFADEILVVDSLSTDGTYEKAQTLGVNVIRRAYEYSASQKNWAIPQAKHQWILLVDADERVTPELQTEIINILKNPPENTPYHFVIKPFWGFFKHYIIQSGFRDGVVGLTIGYIQGYVIFMRYVKLWLLRKNRT